MTAASTAAVEAASTAWGEHISHTPEMVEGVVLRVCRCGTQFATWNEWVTHRWQRVADAVVEALGLRIETKSAHIPHYGSFNEHRCGDPTEPCRRVTRTRYESDWREVAE